MMHHSSDGTRISISIKIKRASVYLVIMILITQVTAQFKCFHRDLITAATVVVQYQNGPPVSKHQLHLVDGLIKTGVFR